MAEISYKSDEDVKTGQLILLIDGLPHAFATSATLSISTNVIDTSNKFDGSWQSGLAGKKSYTVASEALMTEKEGAESYKKLIDAQIAGKPIPFVFGTLKTTEDAATGAVTSVVIDTACPSYKGNLIITSNELKSEAGDLGKHSLQSQGSGPLIPVAAVPAA
jgi:hypothetical protein